MIKVIACLAASMLCISSVNALSIDIFTTHVMPVVTSGFDQKGCSTNIYYIDDLCTELNQLQQSVSGLQKDMAASVAQTFVSAKGADFKQALNSVLAAQRYKINRYPAVVFDGKYEVLGTSDIAYAYQQYLGYIQQQGGKQ